MSFRKKRVYRLISPVVWIWRPSSENVFKPVFRNHSAESFSFFQDRFLCILWTCNSPDPASNPLFAFLSPWYSETSCALQAKVNFLDRYWAGKSGRNFRYAGQPMQFTFFDHPYIKRGLWVVSQTGLNNFTSEVMCAVALGFQFHFLDCFSYVQVKTIVLKWKDYVIDGNNVE